MLEKDQGIATHVEVTGIDRDMSAETQIVLFRIAQEALNNIRKHAHASSVSIRIEGGEAIVMTITDDGEGFEVPEKVEEMVSAGRLGLMGMYERARLLNGHLQMTSEPGKGTKLVVRLPWLTTD